MNPGIIDLPATYAAPLGPTTGTSRLDASGAALPAFAEPVPLWVGRLTPPSVTRTSDQGGGARATATPVFLARWDATLAEGGRLVVEGRDYDILAVPAAPNTARRSWVHLVCSHTTGVNTATDPDTAFP